MGTGRTPRRPVGLAGAVRRHQRCHFLNNDSNNNKHIKDVIQPN